MQRFDTCDWQQDKGISDFPSSGCGVKLTVQVQLIQKAIDRRLFLQYVFHCSAITVMQKYKIIVKNTTGITYKLY